MTIQLTADLENSVKSFLAGGQYADEAEVLREALAALRREEEELAAIQLGIDDMEAGRMRPLEEVDAEIRKKHGFGTP